MLHVSLDFLLKMLQELFHLVAFGFHHFFRNFRSLAIGRFKFMVCQGADLLGLFLGNVPGMSKNRCEDAVQVLHFFLGHI
jgi:hypothetical protein